MIKFGVGAVLRQPEPNLSNAAIGSGYCRTIQQSKLFSSLTVLPSLGFYIQPLHVIRFVLSLSCNLCFALRAGITDSHDASS